MSSTFLAILPTKTHCRFLQQQQIQALKKNGSYASQVLLNKESQLELLWWVKNIKIYNGRILIQHPAQALLQTDALLTGWGSLERNENWIAMYSAGERLHISELDFLRKTSPGNLFESTGDKITTYSDG